MGSSKQLDGVLQDVSIDDRFLFCDQELQLILLAAGPVCTPGACHGAPQLGVCAGLVPGNRY
jgi:hypothetical protein